MPGTERRPEIAPLVFILATPFVVLLALGVVTLFELAPLREVFDGTDSREKLVLGAVGVWGILQVLPYLTFLWVGTTLLMVIGAGGTWLLGQWLRLPARGVSRAALGWLGWGVGVVFTGFVVQHLLGKGGLF